MDNNRWDDARSQRGLDKLPIQTEYKYIGNFEIDFNQIYSDFKDHSDWLRADWYVWNRTNPKRSEIPVFPINDSTKYVRKDQVHFSELRLEEPYEQFEKIYDDLGLMPEETSYRPIKINRQMPGDMLWMHYDYYDAGGEDDNWEKYFIFLNDWAPGQVSLWGEEAIVGWKSGDCYQIDTLITPHGAVNCGLEERWMTTIRGRKK